MRYVRDPSTLTLGLTTENEDHMKLSGDLQVTGAANQVLKGVASPRWTTMSMSYNDLTNTPD